MERNETKAVEYFVKSSEQGSTEARYNLGVLYSGTSITRSSDALIIMQKQKAIRYNVTM